MRLSLICEAEICKIYNTKEWAYRQPQRLICGLTEWGLASQNGVWPQRMGSCPREWGLAPHNEVWPHRMRLCLTEWCRASQNEVWLHRIMSGLKWNMASHNEAFLTDWCCFHKRRSSRTEWGLATHDEVLPHRMRPAWWYLPIVMTLLLACIYI